MDNGGTHHIKSAKSTIYFSLIWLHYITLVDKVEINAYKILKHINMPAKEPNSHVLMLIILCLM